MRNPRELKDLRYHTQMTTMEMIRFFVGISLSLLLVAFNGVAGYSSFHGKLLQRVVPNGATLSMRKQKASDRRTRRLQRGLLEEDDVMTETVTTSPMQTAQWLQKTPTTEAMIPLKTGGRNRSRKRSTLYNSLSSYHNHFLQLLTAEYKAEVSYCLFSISFSLLLKFQKVKSSHWFVGPK